ncbi:hypothetical protein SS50377_20068 [Spironucleus salmonicida]|uniref:Uncharacterized protein n=1 Tax=Spironucleus salmonicida TaxID=348837 RepID=V6LYM7_9EUKA|nr:hypothetical protein SS50377_20068 [Spironucleus salmonicida]|eukprot:EST49363.1 hypothetical protein SS50377_10288 [Spironucleus salmonicida]
MNISLDNMDLDEVEASIRRCEEFLAANDQDYSIFSQKQSSYNQDIALNVSSSTIKDQLNINRSKITQNGITSQITQENITILNKVNVVQQNFPAKIQYSKDSEKTLVKAAVQKPQVQEIQKNKRKQRTPDIKIKQSQISASAKQSAAKKPNVVKVKNEQQEISRSEPTITMYEQPQVFKTQSEQMIYRAKSKSRPSTPIRSIKTVQKIEQLKKEQEKNQMKECTFTPQISSYGRQKSTSVEDTTNRLYLQQQQILQQREQHKYDIQREKFKDCTFTPKINQYHITKSSSQPVEDRLMSEKIQNERRKQQLFEQKELEESSYLNQNTITESHKKRRDMLATRHQQRAMTQSQQRFAQINNEEIECIFRPSINKKSALIVAEQYGDFNERSKIWQNKAQDRFKSTQDQVLQECSFTPIINHSNAIRQNMDFNQAQISQAHDRLYRDAVIRKNMKNSQDRTNDNVINDEDCTFTPTINKVSEQICEQTRNYTMQDDAVTLMYKKQQKIQQLKDNIQEEEDYELVFQPKINKSSQLMQPHYDFQNTNILMAQIEEERQMKNIMLNNKKRELEFEQVEQHMLKSPVRTNLNTQIYEPQQVQGLDSFMSRVNKQKQKEQDQQEVEDKVFGYGQKWSSKPTLIQEFSLSQHTQKAKNHQFVQSVQKVDKTTDQKMRDIVGAILRSEI